jgi:hypothetical protein
VLKLVDVSDYLVAGDEVGASGTPHIQGYVVFKKSTRLSKVIKLLPGAHISIAKGTSQENRTYCCKDGHYEEYGDCPLDTRITAKKNIDVWEESLKLAKEDRIDEIRADMQIRFLRTFERIAHKARPKPPCNEKLLNIWIWGSTGTGKTRWCHDNFPDHYLKLKNKWWCDYNQEKVVIMQEIGRMHSKLSEYIKEWADHYPFRAEVKNGGGVFNMKCLIITSNYHPEMLWNEEEILEPLLRRFIVLKFPDEKPTEEKIQEWKDYIDGP